MDFAKYLVDVEGKQPRTALQYDEAMTSWLAAPSSLPRRSRDVERLQWAWIAWRRWLDHEGLDASGTPWLPVRKWAADWTDRGVDRGGQPDEIAHPVVLVEASRDGVRGTCLICDEVTTANHEELLEEVARGVAAANRDEHHYGHAGLWCYDIPAEDRRVHVLYLEPPVFRSWQEIREARGENGDVARNRAAQVAMHIFDDALAEAEEYASTGGGGGCSCGYMSVASWSDGGDPCPVCGPAGWG